MCHDVVCTSAGALVFALPAWSPWSTSAFPFTTALYRGVLLLLVRPHLALACEALHEEIRCNRALIGGP